MEVNCRLNGYSYLTTMNGLDFPAAVVDLLTTGRTDHLALSLGQAPRISLVVDRELSRVAEPRRLGAKDARAGGMERHQPHPARVMAEQPPHAAAHLLCGLVREGDRQDLVRLRLIGVDQERDPVREHPRLAAAGTGQDQQRALAVRDRLALGLVEGLEQLLEMLGMRVCGHLVRE